MGPDSGMKIQWVDATGETAVEFPAQDCIGDDLRQHRDFALHRKQSGLTKIQSSGAAKAKGPSPSRFLIRSDPAVKTGSRRSHSCRSAPGYVIDIAFGALNIVNGTPECAGLRIH